MAHKSRGDTSLQEDLIGFPAPLEDSYLPITPVNMTFSSGF